MSELERLRREEREIGHWDAECDVLIVGAGVAGICASIEARQAGAGVMVLERTGGLGGASALSGGLVYLGGGTPLQKACGFEDSPEEMFKYMMAACGPEPDASLIQPYCEGSVEHFHWIAEKGVPFKPEFFAGAHEPFGSDEGLTFSGGENAYPFNEIAKPAPRAHIPQQVRGKGGVLMKHLIAAAEASGIESRLQNRCDGLVVASDGRVVGAVVSTLEGEQCIRARRGVVLTAGGFIYNEDMLERYAPLLRPCFLKVGTESDDGLGIRLGMAVGASAIRMQAGDISLSIFPPNELRQGLLVNRHGQRYVNEDAYMGRLGEFSLFNQEGRVYLIVDDDIYDHPNKAQVLHEEFVPAEVVAVGETIKELEAELGVAELSLQHTVSQYNHHAEQGVDPLFHKAAPHLKPLVTPPFGALALSVDGRFYAAFTLGGLRIDSGGSVLQASGDAIPGLFAAGRTTSGIPKQGYASGMSLGDGSFFGRRAGRSAAGSR